MTYLPQQRLRGSKQVCGVTTDQKYQLADLRLRPLPLEMEKYARMDTTY
jgi:ribonuclease D